MRITPPLSHTAITDGTETSHPKDDAKPNNNASPPESNKTAGYSGPNPKGGYSRFLLNGAKIGNVETGEQEKTGGVAQTLATSSLERAANGIANSTADAIGNHLHQVLKSLNSQTTDPQKKLAMLKEVLGNFATGLESTTQLFQSAKQFSKGLSALKENVSGQAIQQLAQSREELIGHMNQLQNHGPLLDAASQTAWASATQNLIGAHAHLPYSAAAEGLLKTEIKSIKNDDHALALIDAVAQTLPEKTSKPESVNGLLTAFVANPNISNKLKQQATSQLVDKYLSSPPSMESAVGIADLMTNSLDAAHFPQEKTKDALKFIGECYAGVDKQRLSTPEARAHLNELKSSMQEMGSLVRKAITA